MIRLCIETIFVKEKSSSGNVLGGLLLYKGKRYENMDAKKEAFTPPNLHNQLIWERLVRNKATE